MRVDGLVYLFENGSDDRMSGLPPDLKGNLEVALSGLFTLSRNNRNDARHSTGKAVELEQPYSYLLVFST